MKPLRAFLFAQGSIGEWTSTAHREWEPLLEAALAALAGGTRSAAIHVGFWRPETSKVAELAQGWPGRLLLSEAAIGALPPPPRVSAALVGSINGLGFRLVLEGFGYEIEDPAPGPVRTAEEASGAQTAPTPTHRGWVAQLIASKPRLSDELSTTGIWDEETYQANESKLETGSRHNLAFERYLLIVGKQPTPANILNNLQACPPWFLDDKIEYLNLTVRLANVFRTYGIETIGDLASKGYNGLLLLPNLGQGSIHALASLLHRAFLDGDVLTKKHLHDDLRPSMDRASTDAVPVASAPLIETIPDIVSGFVEAAQLLTIQERGVWAARTGFRCEPQTLQQISDQIGLTRERVRQIELKIYNKIGRHRFWPELGDRLDALLEGRSAPLMLEGLAALDPWFKGSDQLAFPLEEVFGHIFDSKFSVIKIGAASFVSHLSESAWNEAVDTSKALLHAAVPEKIDEDYAKSQIESLLVGQGEELREELWAEVSRLALWAQHPGKPRALSGFGRTAEAVVQAVLDASVSPLRIEEIYRQASLLIQPPPDLRAINRAAQSIALIYGRATYGLLSQCPLSADERALIRGEAEDAIAGGDAARQWHTSELFDELMARSLDFDGRLTKYIINIALRESKCLVYMQRMVWGLKESWTGGAASRLDVRQAVISLLETEGKPLTTGQIREKLMADRGVSASFQIFNYGPLVRIGTGMWGLAHRDITLKNLDLLLEQLDARLQTLQHGLHVSEIAAAVGGLNEDEVQPLLTCGRQRGLRVDRWQYVYPAAWGESRRFSTAEAIKIALAERQATGASFDEIRKTVNRLTLREVPGMNISQLLQNIEAERDPVTGFWRAESHALENLETEDGDE